jgi:uridine phosphorylase
MSGRGSTLDRRLMDNRRRFSHGNNPGFRCEESVLLLPFGRTSYLPAIVEATGGEAVGLNETTDRIVFQLREAPLPATLVYSGMGGPAIANALEMIAANGGRTVVLFGACGGVGPEVGIGDLIVATGGVRGDGASLYYAPAQYPAIFDFRLSQDLWSAARSGENVRSHRGVVFTTDASYRQDAEVYEQYAGLIVGVDCEAAPTAVVGSRLGLTVAGLLFCTDNVTLAEEEDRVYRGLSDPRVRRGFERGLEVSLQALVEYSQTGLGVRSEVTGAGGPAGS